MCSHDQCFEQKKSSENEHFYNREILLYIAWTCFRIGKHVEDLTCTCRCNLRITSLRKCSREYSVFEE